MPWNASSVTEERLRFVAPLLDAETMTDASTTRSARGCHPCLRHDPSPMCPGWTTRGLVGDDGLEPPTSCV
jgi:hypothetical protein